MCFILFFLLFSEMGEAKQDLNSTNCTLLQENFATAMSAFVACAINHSRPITFCENCVYVYLDMDNIYKQMQATTANDSHCIDTLINLDRLQIVQTLYRNTYSLWNNAKCYECFTVENGTLTPKKSQETITFNEKYQKYTSCIGQEGLNDSTICAACIKSYTDLDTYYVSISNENEKIGVCMDIVDLMNTTRAFWSAKCCKYRRHSEWIFIGCTASVLLVSVLFYVFAQVFAKNTTPTVLKQNRWIGGSLNHDS